MASVLECRPAGAEGLGLRMARDVAADAVQGVGLSGVALGQVLQAGQGALQAGRRGFLAGQIRCLCKRPVAELKF